MAEALLRFLRDSRLLPFAMSLVLGAVTLGWNGDVGLSWDGPGILTILLSTVPLLLLAAYAKLRAMRFIAEAIVISCMYMIVPLIAVRLSYLVTTLQFPLVDASLSGFDHALGFDWSAWTDVVNTHPALHTLTFADYLSPIAQALISAAIFSRMLPGKRNFELLFILVLALMAAIGIFALLPELGPASLAGMHVQMEANIRAVRAGSLGPFPYLGIVSFPSFHTVMAIAFTYAHRGLRSFWPFAVLNAFMLLGTPAYGDHYLADMFGGASVAAFAILLARSVYGSGSRAVRADDATPAWGGLAAE